MVFLQAFLALLARIGRCGGLLGQAAPGAGAAPALLLCSRGGRVRSRPPFELSFTHDYFLGS